MSDYKIVTDSTSDLTQELVERTGVTVIPMNFTIGDDSFFDYPDKREISSHDFYTRLSAGESSTTNQISLATFTDTFEPMLKDGFDVLYLGFSSGLSGTYNNSVIAAKDLASRYPERKIYAVDTLAASMGEGLLVWHAAQLQKEGKTIDEVKEWMEQNRLRLHHWFTVDDLNHLKRGGRISGASALVGTMLGIKPVMHVDNDGHLILISKIRGRKQSLDELVAHMKRTAVEPEKQMIFIASADSEESSEYVKKQVASKLGARQFSLGSIGPVIGAHSGPGTLALFYLGTDRQEGLEK